MGGSTRTGRAGFVSRLAAFAADAVVLAGALRGSVWFLGAAARVLRSSAHRVDIAGHAAPFLPLLMAVYLVVFWRVSGQTPGKWLVGVKVVRLDGRPMTVARALLRFGAYLLSAAPLYLGFLWILRPPRLGWHDRIARTEVVYVTRT